LEQDGFSGGHHGEKGMHMDPQTNKTELKLDVLCWQRDGRPFVGQCLQYDVAVQASSIEELKKLFARALATYFMERAQKLVDAGGTVQEVFDLNPAPRRFWELAASGVVEHDDLPIYVPSPKTSVRANFRVTKQLPTDTGEAHSCI
jgi:hypothetical protein